MPSTFSEVPRVLDVDLAGGDPSAVWRVEPLDLVFSGEPCLERVASWGGSATALALLLVEARRGRGDGVLAVTVGGAVRAGLPTAARAGVIARAPLSMRLAEGQVGGDLGPRLGAVCDVLFVHGQTSVPGAVLVVDGDGTAGIQTVDGLASASPAERYALLISHFGACAVLTLGEAGERGLPFASLASGGPRPSFVGRGGLGAVLGGAGLAAIVVRAEAPVPVQSEMTRELLQRLGSSPRLGERSARGTHELYGAFAARGALGVEHARRIQKEAGAKARAHKGCRGCPTPCGWEFELADGGRQGAHFSATHALGERLGLDGFDDALVLLRECDRAGADAKELGALLELACLAAESGALQIESARGKQTELIRWIRAIVRREGEFARLAVGPARFAAELGLEYASVRGTTVRPERELALVLGQCTSAAGSDPMRSFPFLFDMADEESLARIIGELPLAGGVLDPLDPRAKGRLVAWHENLVSGVDLTGFCAFSTAGLLADEAADLDQLARWILPRAVLGPEEERAGERLLAAGAALVLVRRELNRVWGGAAGDDLPPWARERLAAPGMFPEYALCRGLAADGGPSAESWAELGQTALARRGWDSLDTSPARVEPTPSATRTPGLVRLRAGDLSRVDELGLPLPAPLSEVLEARSSSGPHPAVFRGGKRLLSTDLVFDGDLLDLVTAIAGG